MAYIRLRINNREFELEGTEEFIARMEKKIMSFWEGADKHFPQSSTSDDLQTFGKSGEELTQTDSPVEATNEYIRGFTEKYNNFNSNLSAKKSY